MSTNERVVRVRASNAPVATHLARLVDPYSVQAVGQRMYDDENVTERTGDDRTIVFMHVLGPDDLYFIVANVSGFLS